MIAFPPFGQDIGITILLVLILLVGIYALYIYSTDLEFGEEVTKSNIAEGEIVDKDKIADDKQRSD